MSIAWLSGTARASRVSQRRNGCTLGQVIDRKKAAFALVVLLALAACGGSPGTGEPATSVETDAVATSEPTSPPAAESATPPEATAGEVDNGNGKPATISLVLSGTTTQVDGSYSGSGPARLCGNAVMNLTGNPREFSFEFPLDDGGDQIRDVTFSAEDLVPGTSTASFHIGVNVKAADGHEPPALVIDTEQAGSDDTGSAQLAESAGTTTLTVDAADELGQTIQMTASCGPR